MRAKVLILAAFALASPATAWAQAQANRWELQVQRQLDRANMFLSGRGYALTHAIQTGALRDHGTESFTLELQAGHTYALLGVCDADCMDIDLRLFNQDGDEVDADIETTYYPIVEVQPVHTAQFRVHVVMATCQTSACRYGVGVFGK